MEIIRLAVRVNAGASAAYAAGVSREVERYRIPVGSEDVPHDPDQFRK
jgi:hypothetical protein